MEPESNSQTEAPENTAQAGFGEAHGSALVMLAAHAPEVPEWFRPKQWKGPVRCGVNPNHMQMGTIFEDPMKHMARWRAEFARAVLAELQNTQVSDPAELDSLD